MPGKFKMEQLSFNFDICQTNCRDLKDYPVGTYLLVHYLTLENRVTDALFKVIKHMNDSVEVLFHYHYDKERRTFRNTILKHAAIIKFKEYN